MQQPKNNRSLKNVALHNHDKCLKNGSHNIAHILPYSDH